VVFYLATEFGFATGTVGSGEESLKDHPGGGDIRRACAATLQAPEAIPVEAIPLLDVAACVALDTASTGRHCDKANTVRVTGHSEPRQPVPICPRAEHAAHILAHAPCELGLVVDPPKPLDHNEINAFDDVSRRLVYQLPQGATSAPLALRARNAAIDP